MMVWVLITIFAYASYTIMITSAIEGHPYSTPAPMGVVTTTLTSTTTSAPAAAETTTLVPITSTTNPVRRALAMQGLYLELTQLT